MAQSSGGMKAQKYKSRHPPEHYLAYQEWARQNDPDAKYPVYGVLRFILVPLMRLFYRAEAIGTENIPEKGMVILVPNHFSFFDHFMVGMFVPRKVRFMAKSQLFDSPIRWILRHGGVFPVARGLRDQYAFETGRIILEDKRQPVVMYVQGGRDRTHEIHEPAKAGVGKLAYMTGAPIIPVAVYGTQYLRHWKRLWLFPKVVVRFGEPINTAKLPNATRDQEQALSDEVYGHIKRLYNRTLADVPRRWFHAFRP